MYIKQNLKLNLNLMRQKIYYNNIQKIYNTLDSTNKSKSKRKQPIRADANISA